MIIAWMGFVFQAFLSYRGLFPTHPFDQWGPEIVDDPELAHRAHFEPWALGGTDKHGEHENPKFWTLDSLMELNGARSRFHSSDPRFIAKVKFSRLPLIGHTFIDILKIGIEGGEYKALASFITAYAGKDLPIGQLQLEIHSWDGQLFIHFVKWWEYLEAAGLRPFWMEPNLVYMNIFRSAGSTLTEVRFSLYAVL